MTAQFIILTLAIINEKNTEKPNRYGLQLDERDKIEAIDCTKLSIELSGQTTQLDKSLKSYNNHGRLTNPEINDWIQERSIYKFNPQLKLIFRLERKGTEHKYILYPNQGNCIVYEL